jgi:hypothetical protein
MLPPLTLLAGLLLPLTLPAQAAPGAANRLTPILNWHTLLGHKIHAFEPADVQASPYYSLAVLSAAQLPPIATSTSLFDCADVTESFQTEKA